jgi:glycosyltransferase involved in cell wall biosynthesis
VQRVAIRNTISISPSAIVVGHIGSYTAQKNPHFLQKIATVLAKRNPVFHFVFVGNPRVAELYTSSEFRERVHVLGYRDDVMDLLPAMDVFLFPSRYEGLGIVLLEAQASGIPCVYSSNIPEDVIVIPKLMIPVSLAAPPETWAREVEQVVRGRVGLTPDEARQSFIGSNFDVRCSVRSLEKVYASTLRQTDN